MTKVSPRGLYFKIDRGLVDDMEKGRRVDIYKPGSDGENILIAEGQAFEVKASSAIIKITKRFRNVRVKTGFVVRAR